MKQYTVNEVIELQNQKKQLEQRLEVHRQRVKDKEEELKKLFAEAGVNNIEELNQICIESNNEMQKYANQVAENIQNMKEACDELDRML